MNVGELQTNVRLAANMDDAQAPKADIMTAANYAGNVFVNETRCVITSFTKTLTQYFSEVDLSNIYGLRKEFLISIELGLKDRGSWAETAYVLRDLVQGLGGSGLGTADTYFYKCIKAHTGDNNVNEPGSTAGNEFWTRVHTKIGDPMEGPISFEEMRRKFNGSGATDEPTFYGFDDADTLHVYPAPDVAYELKGRFYDDFSALAADSSDSFDLNIPDRYIQPVVWEGIPALLAAGSPDALASDPLWLRFTRESIPRVRNRVHSGRKFRRKIDQTPYFSGGRFGSYSRRGFFNEGK
jgi:hypothetical protein